MTATERRGETATRAHRSSLQITPQDLVTALCLKLGARLVAFIVDKNPSTITRWRNGTATASEETLQPLRVAYQVFDLLESEESDHTIRAWFIGLNPQLDDESPVEALLAGNHRDVLAAARAFHTGG